MKNIDEEIERMIAKQNDIALQLVGDMEIHEDLGNLYSCLVSKKLYHAFQKLDAELIQLHDIKTK
jgi:hypothetical protein